MGSHVIYRLDGKQDMVRAGECAVCGVRFEGTGRGTESIAKNSHRGGSAELHSASRARWLDSSSGETMRNFVRASTGIFFALTACAKTVQTRPEPDEPN